MTDSIIIEKAINEIFIKEFGTTEQLLEIHEVVYENEKPKVLRVDKESSDGTAIVYFPLKDEKFYLAIWLDTEPEVNVRSVTTEYFNSVYLNVTSDHFSFQELAKMTKLQMTGGWNKGDIRKSGKSTYNFTALHFEPNPEPDEFNDKLKKLLDFLDQDNEGVTKLIDQADAQIQVVTIFHNGNTILGGHHLNKSIIKRLASYNLEIDFDLYAEGKFFKT
ncbi:MAG: DUF4279 domain-containing protein [Bacteroidota bacterium]|nr:DUF4279 domain-containing protein [Bacteroidota bacterium]